MSIISAVELVRTHLEESVREGYTDARRALDSMAERLTDKTESAVFTESMAARLRRNGSIRAETPPSAVMTIADEEGQQFSFRFNRSRLRKGAGDVYSGEDLLGPRLNKVSEATAFDFLLLWVSEERGRVDLWLCAPHAAPTSAPGTQLATIDQVNGRRWRSAICLGRFEVSSVPAVGPDVVLEPVAEDVELPSAPPAGASLPGDPLNVRKKS